MKVQLNWKNPKIEMPKEEDDGSAVCVLLTVHDAKYPVKVWASDLGFYTPNGDRIYNDQIIAWDYCPDKFQGEF